MILDKINVPVERQRIVYGGKQLLDENHVVEYGNIYIYSDDSII